MIPVTQATKTALQAPVKQMRATITWQTSPTDIYTLTSEDKIISIKKEAEGYFCKSTLRKITIVLAGTDTNLLDQRVSVTPQVKTGANTWGDIPWGSFYISESTVDEAKGITTCVGYGGIATMQNREYTAGELTFPTTVGGLLQQIAEKFALDIDESVKILPAEYQQVEYLESSGTQYIATDYTFTAYDHITIKVAPKEGGDKSIFGSYETGGANCELGTLSDQFRGNLAPSGDGYDYQTGQVYTLELQSGKWHCGSVGFGNIKNTTATVNAYIFARNYASSPKPASVKLYSASMERNGATIHDFIPCYRKSDNKPGLYDFITGTFYTNSGTGEFTVGADHDALPNIDAPITEDLWAKISGTTYRDILEEIAGATGTIAVIGRGDDRLNLNLPPISEASETLTEANLITAKIGEKWGRVSGVVLSRQPQGDNIEVLDQATANLPAGKNLFSYGAYPITRNPATGLAITTTNNTINIKAETTTGAQYYGILITLEPGKTYILSAKGRKIVKGVNGQPRLALYTQSSPDGLYSWRTEKYAVVSDPVQGQEYEMVTNPWTVTAERPYYRLLLYNNSSTPVTIGEETEYWDIQLEESDQATPFEPFKANGRVDLVIANNEILDPQRETTATPILNAVKGWGYRNAEIKTEGHGYHEIGDRLDITVAGETYTTVVTKSVIQIDGGIKETLTSATPEIVPIDYAKTGGITKTVFRTELAVDKQEQRIDAIVSRQDATDAQVAEQFTQVSQDLDSITATIQQSGGGNLIRNSVGYGKNADGTLTVWQYGTGADTTTVKSQSSPASLNAGAVSGYEIMLTGAAGISQEVALTPGETYTISARAQKGSTGSATITIANGTNSATLEFADQTSYAWRTSSVNFVPAEGTNTVTITSTAGTTIEITDLMLTTGGKTTWRQASSEIYNTQVSLDQSGVRVSSSVYAGDYVEITPLEFAGWSNAGGTMKKVFTLNRDTTEVEKLEARTQIKMPPLKIVPINNSSYKGWAFVKEEN